MISNTGFREYFDAVISLDMQKDIVKYIFTGYKDADKMIKTQDFQPQPAKNLYPYARWAMIDNYCLALNKKYDRVQAASRPNTINNCFFTLITCSNVRMTISAVNSPKSMPRLALFRNSLASCQYRFDIGKNNRNFEFMDLESKDAKTVYCFVLHGPLTDNHREPSFINIVFPNEDCTRCLDRINLFRRFPDFVEELRLEGIELVPDKAEVALREDIRQEKLL